MDEPKHKTARQRLITQAEYLVRVLKDVEYSDYQASTYVRNYLLSIKEILADLDSKDLLEAYNLGFPCKAFIESNYKLTDDVKCKLADNSSLTSLLVKLVPYINNLVPEIDEHVGCQLGELTVRENDKFLLRIVAPRIRSSLHLEADLLEAFIKSSIAKWGDCHKITLDVTITSNVVSKWIDCAKKEDFLYENVAVHANLSYLLCEMPNLNAVDLELKYLARRDSEGPDTSEHLEVVIFYHPSTSFNHKNFAKKWQSRFKKSNLPAKLYFKKVITKNV